MIHDEVGLNRKSASTLIAMNKKPNFVPTFILQRKLCNLYQFSAEDQHHNTASRYNTFSVKVQTENKSYAGLQFNFET